MTRQFPSPGRVPREKARAGAVHPHPRPRSAWTPYPRTAGGAPPSRSATPGGTTELSQVLLSCPKAVTSLRIWRSPGGRKALWGDVHGGSRAGGRPTPATTCVEIPDSAWNPSPAQESALDSQGISGDRREADGRETLRHRHGGGERSHGHTGVGAGHRARWERGVDTAAQDTEKKEK